MKLTLFYSAALLNVILIIMLFLIILPAFSLPAGLPVVLPKASFSEAITAKRLVILLLKDDVVFIDSKKLPLGDLAAYLDEISLGSASVLIKADDRISLKALVKVWDILRRAGVGTVHIATNES